MLAKTGFACGICSMCEKEICRHRPTDMAVCDCWQNCPLCGAEMQPYTPELSLSTYESGEIDVLLQCQRCGYSTCG